MRDSKVSTKDGIVNLHPTKETHWICYIDEYYLNSNGCQPPKHLFDFLIQKYAGCVFSK